MSYFVISFNYYYSFN